MFEKLKQIGKLKEVQKSLEEENVEVERKGTRIVLNGNLKIISVSLNSALEKEEQEEVLKECLNDGVEKIKGSMAQKFQSML